ncbi:MAG: hypothetical protein SAJ37_01680 [Oscillatoria sp. PMC 1068.18]|nr:hypothetical protein [Oscillatoria sp. PMC 1076.18]MEC4987433.1 hypothetical protein [Oscillatoria sp. PMC 1068.18]
MNRLSQEMLKKAPSIHRESLRRNLQHRLEVARAKGDQKLVSQLEAEANYLGLN